MPFLNIFKKKNKNTYSDANTPDKKKAPTVIPQENIRHKKMTQDEAIDFIIQTSGMIIDRNDSRD
ncbi:hypothetical protein BGZ76_006114, partial [Entomortierella beljakovae]